MRSYLNSKLLLFKKILSKKSKIIIDKEIKPFSAIKKISKKRNLKVVDIKTELEKVKKKIFKNYTSFKIKNLAMAIKAAKLSGLNEKLIYKTIDKLKDVDGRLELVKAYPNNIRVFVDYAHTPDALIKTLNELKINYKGELP